MENKNNIRWLVNLSAGASVLALCVIVLGAFVRLSDAGLGCPDWPGCYGQIIAPTASHEITVANEAFPHRPVETAKAWKEMAHRYLASSLGLFIILLAAGCWKHRKQLNIVKLPVALVILVIFQGLLGMWTVTLLLKPAIVSMHLLMGMLTLALLWLTTLRLYRANCLSFEQEKEHQPVTIHETTLRRLRILAAIALFAVYGQIALGGWTSTNYVALHCWDLPTCQEQWWPEMDFAEGFTLWRGLGVDYEGGVLSFAAGTAVHMTHRIGALTVFFVVGLFVLTLLFSDVKKRLKQMAIVTSVVLCAQVCLGILNILLVLPVPIATAHNGGAALLLISIVTLNYQLFGYRRELAKDTLPVSSSSVADHGTSTVVLS